VNVHEVKNFHAYLDSFPTSVQEIINNFEFRNPILRLAKADALGTLIEKFFEPSTKLSSCPALNSDGTVLLPGLDNQAMGTILEQLVCCCWSAASTRKTTKKPVNTGPRATL
jgi:type I restriction enzyme M protein